MSLVLCTDVDPALLETRRLLLEQAGHIVITKAQEGEIVKACLNYQFDVVVIGYSAPAPIKRSIFRLVRRYCKSAKILELTNADSARVLEDADSWLEIDALQPETLPEQIALLMRHR
jgi:DNA-binding response OmpR family regulator